MLQTDENISFIVLRQFKKPVEKAGIACMAGLCYTGIVKRVCPEFGINTYADMPTLEILSNIREKVTPLSGP